MELHQKEAVEEGMSYEAKAQRYMPIQLSNTSDGRGQ